MLNRKNKWVPKAGDCANVELLGNSDNIFSTYRNTGQTDGDENLKTCIYDIREVTVTTKAFVVTLLVTVLEALLHVFIHRCL